MFAGFGLGSTAARNNLAASEATDAEGLIEIDMTQAQADACEDAIYALSHYTRWIAGNLGGTGTDFDELTQLVVDEAARTSPAGAVRLKESLDNVIVYCELTTKEGREVTLRGRIAE